METDLTRPSHRPRKSILKSLPILVLFEPYTTQDLLFSGGLASYIICAVVWHVMRASAMQDQVG